jgi:hypothetical protein
MNYTSPNAARIDTTTGSVVPLPERLVYSDHGVPNVPHWLDTLPAPCADDVTIGQWFEVLEEDLHRMQNEIDPSPNLTLRGLAFLAGACVLVLLAFGAVWWGTGS